LVSPRLDEEFDDELDITTDDDELAGREELLELVATDEELKLDEVFDELDEDADDTTAPPFVYCSIQS
jgi:hypothetical protein